MSSNKEQDVDIIQLIQQTFSKVNDKIDELISCSVKDFVLLNTDFKQYYSLLEKASASTNSFFGFIHQITSELSPVEVTCQTIDDANEIQLLNKQQLLAFKELKSNFQLVILQINNLRQDLSTLLLLYTNLRFDPEFTGEKLSVNNCIEKVNACFNLFETNIREITDKLESTINHSEQGYSKGLDLFLDLIGKRSKQNVYFGDLKQSAKAYYSQLEEIDKQRKTSTSEIITNLQFQDILRQKVEHIQEAHSRITQNLYANHTSGDSLNVTELYQLRDISSLQSAQLVHANKEYQTAIESILNRINTLKLLTNSYNNIWLNYCRTEKARILHLLSNLEEDTTLLQTQIFSLNQLSISYNHLVDELTVPLKGMENLVHTTPCLCETLQEFDQLIANYEIVNTGKDPLNPLKQIKKESEKFRTGHLKLINNLRDLLADQAKNIGEVQQKSKFKLQRVSDFTDKIINLMQDIRHLSNENLTVIDFKPMPVEYGIEKVAYFQTFENEVKAIIALLNELIEKVKLNNKDIDSSNLEHLKKMYTMQSERDIHNQMTQSTDIVNEKKNDEVEFF